MLSIFGEVKEWLSNILCKISMPHFYHAKSFKKNMLTVEKKHNQVTFLFKLFISILYVKGLQQLILFGLEEKNERVSLESVVELFGFCFLSSCINFLGSDDGVLFWKLFVFLLVRVFFYSAIIFQLWRRY